MKINRGFTLIELLVVIAVIGILASIILATVNSARLKSRDSYRVSTLLEMAKAIEINADPLAPVVGCALAWDDVRNCTVTSSINFTGDVDPLYTGSFVTCKRISFVTAPLFFGGKCQFSITRLSDPTNGAATTQDYQLCSFLEGTIAGTQLSGLISATSAKSGSLSQGCL